MSLFYLLLLAIIQGITEFLPVSSSGHLVLLPNVVGAEDQGPLIDVSVILYFWSDVRAGLLGVPRMLTGRIDTPGARLAFLLCIATVPLVIVGFIVNETGAIHALRSIEVIGWSMLVFGIVLYVFDQKGTAEKQSSDWTLRDAIIMGLWQVIALIPGSSRSGVTITGARALGYSRTEGARLAMLMSIPAISASGVLLGIEAAGEANWGMLKYAAISAALSFVAALFALKIMMRLLQSVSFTPYVIYRVILGLVLLAVAYS